MVNNAENLGGEFNIEHRINLLINYFLNFLLDLDSKDHQFAISCHGPVNGFQSAKLNQSRIQINGFIQTIMKINVHRIAEKGVKKIKAVSFGGKEKCLKYFMQVQNQIKLKESSVRYLPLSSYPNDFTFIVNGQKFPTSRVVADLLSRNIRELHSKDPTIDHFIINTDTCGDFSSILQLTNFAENSINDEVLPFYISVFEVLNTDLIEVEHLESQNELNINTIFSQIRSHEEHPHFYRQILEREFEFVSSHFYEISEELENQFIALQLSSIEEIIKNKHLKLKSEDQLLNIINKLYSQHSEYSYLYCYVDFLHISVQSMLEFLQLFNINDIFTETWTTLSKRLEQEIIIPKEANEIQRNRIHEDNPTTAKGKQQQNPNLIEVQFDGNNQLNGLINTLKSRVNISNAITLTSSGISQPSSHPIENILIYDNPEKYTYTNNVPNSWICIDFNNYRVKPTHYTLGTSHDASSHLKSWKIQGFDGNEWYTLDEQANNNALNEKRRIHTFPIQSQSDKYYKCIKIEQTSTNWDNNNYLDLSAFEFHGSLQIP